MKLFEDLESLGGSIKDAVRKIITMVYKQDIEDDHLDEIVSGLSLHNLLELDRAYTTKDVNSIKDILGPMPQMEYSMGNSVTSQAAKRPIPANIRNQNSGAKQDAAPAGQTPSKYSSGAQNAVTTSNVKVNVAPNGNAPDDEQESDETDDQNNMTRESVNVVNMIEWLQHRAGIRNK